MKFLISNLCFAVDDDLCYNMDITFVSPLQPESTMLVSQKL